MVVIRHWCCLLIFFFQAEDGIRDRDVTGVQTCALPISWDGWEASSVRPGVSWSASARTGWWTRPSRRSEERRVGKECRLRWAAWQIQKKEKKDDEKGVELKHKSRDHDERSRQQTMIRR